jgi:hypothetical protein
LRDIYNGGFLAQDNDQTGFISLDLLKLTVPHGRHVVYVCGPDPMMKALIPALRDWGVDEADIHRESIGAQTVAPKPVTEATGPVLAVGFRRSGRTIDWTGQDATVLDFAERHTVLIESGCRSGSCGACETRPARRYVLIQKLVLFRFWSSIDRL